MPLWKRRDPAEAAREQEIKTLLLQLQPREKASPDDVVAAAQKLGELRARQAVKPLIALVVARNDVLYGRTKRNAAVKALGQIGDPSAIEPMLRSVVYDELSTETLDALKALSVPKTIQLAIKCLQDPQTRNPHTRSIRGALVACGSDAVEPLIALLRAKDRTVAEVACVALGEIGDQRAVPALIDVLKESDSRLVAASASALRLLRDPRAALPLVPLVAHSDAMVRERAVDALVMLKDPAVADPLASLLGSGNDATRISAARALVYLGHSQAVSVQTFSAMLNNPAVSATDQQEAVNVLGSIGMSRPDLRPSVNQILADALARARDARLKRVLARELGTKFCQQCGTSGTSREFAQRPFEFCSAECREAFGRKLFRLHRDDIMSDVLRSGGSWVTLGSPSPPSPQDAAMFCKHCGDQASVSSKKCSRCEGDLT